MSAYSRFRCPSDTLSLRELLKQTQHTLWFGLILTLGIHFSLTQLRGLKEEKKAVKPLTTQFVKRQPRLTKPLELKKRPRPKRRITRRKMVAVKARANRQQVTSRLSPVDMLEGLSTPRVSIRRGIETGRDYFEPSALALSIRGTREAANRVDMTLEMIDITALDTGQYQAMVIQDPGDKRSIRGFFHLALVYSKTIEISEPRVGFNWDRAVRALVAAMNRFTQIECDIRGRFSFDDGELLSTPWIFVAARFPFRITQSEAHNLGRYLTHGGFCFTGNSFYDGNRPGSESLRQMHKDALATQHLQYGKDWAFEILPNDHLVYHCYFDFDGPPPGSSIHWVMREGGGEYSYLEAIFLDGRLVVIYSTKYYVSAWGNWGLGSTEPGHRYKDNTRQLQFGINTIIFALAQEGSITNRVMDVVGH